MIHTSCCILVPWGLLRTSEQCSKKTRPDKPPKAGLHLAKYIMEIHFQLQSPTTTFPNDHGSWYIFSSIPHGIEEYWIRQGYVLSPMDPNGPSTLTHSHIVAQSTVSVLSSLWLRQSFDAAQKMIAQIFFFIFTTFSSATKFQQRWENQRRTTHLGELVDIIAKQRPAKKADEQKSISSLGFLMVSSNIWMNTFPATCWIFDRTDGGHGNVWNLREMAEMEMEMEWWDEGLAFLGQLFCAEQPYEAWSKLWNIIEICVWLGDFDIF